MRDLIRRKIIDALAAPTLKFTRRDVHVPAIADKAIAVIGMRRAGKTTLLWQILQDRLAAGTPREGLLADRFAIGTAPQVIVEVRSGVKRFAEFAEHAGVPEKETRDRERQLLFLPKRSRKAS
jgi:ATPase subunit of ABC transporter with duplicated ATPase domains